ncbi:exosortase-associated protein EpsI, B-type [Glaciimonas sp. PAMC28666]|uniref:exosortase-associated protein EpsI, B-type n=1 Tax=Glaciimonas sp. PAMC28666 TaxID=2807626 RepID=UPI001966C990|nr:exosortase-associated protein EpsI, B-type [Glaciimonas sp. PAMC28666]QRX82868.1 EpsI family protein [Glaciimonas sp. PAMC28666]
MIKPSPRSLALLVLMLLAFGLASFLRPTHKMSAESPAFDLQAIIPASFNGWKEELQPSILVVDTTQKEILDKIYDQSLSRTYVNSDGYHIMLAIAYGGDQQRDLQIHRPEVCYLAQGFSVSGIEKVRLRLNGSEIPAMRLATRLGVRMEPVTYWVRIGDKIVRGNIEQGLARTAYGLRGRVADGLLFRVSSIDQNQSVAFAYQEKFVNALLEAIALSGRKILLGEQKLDSLKGHDRSDTQLSTG